MAANTHHYNPLIHRDRQLGQSESEWVRSFACEDMTVLIVCRGPIRREALDVFAEMGMTRVGVLLSEKDSIVYPRALAPELRRLDPSRVHAVSDYSGATKGERNERIAQIIKIARDHGYGYIFAGYGFMAEDEEFVRSIEEAGLRFVGPCSHTVQAAGFKDEAKRTAERVDVSVTPGINNATARLLLRKHSDLKALRQLAKKHGFAVAELDDDAVELETVADAVLAASYDAGIDLYTVDELADQIQIEVASVLEKDAGSRIRLKAIGGGGGKGQRIVTSADQAPARVREILSEVKALGVGDNKNILVELNIETTRHNEIQLLGNGTWTVSLGGRDCSLQMHEQKLLEVSVTQETLAAAAERERTAGNDIHADALEQDLEILRRMEEEAERFGEAVKLDSASTFECIVDGPRHYFMEVNTRIQVEHRVSELCYALRFHNPDDANDSFDVHSLVEAMALLAKHKARLPRPERVRREAAAVEARLNATDQSLSPHAGGEIMSWSDPIEGEVRDDQGICFKNPDTDLFMRYKLAGAYDSNIALLVTTGGDRLESYDRLREVLRRTVIRGPDLQTNLQFHYGLVHWFLANGVDAKPTTRFVVPYLTLVGELLQEASDIDADYAYDRLCAQYLKAASGDPAAARATTDLSVLKRTLLGRPLGRLLRQPHLLSAWLSSNKTNFEVKDRRVTWLRNPLLVLADTYDLLHMDAAVDLPAAHKIWEQDQRVLRDGAAFYAEVQNRVGDLPWPKVDDLLKAKKPAKGFDAKQWQHVREAHLGFQLGMELYSLLPLIADKAGFFDLRVNDDLTISIPQRLFDLDHQTKMKKVLVPPPVNKADEIVAVSGGMYYAQEAPGMPCFIEEGQHFEVGDPLYIVEVMKMFNKVYAPFAGTVDKILVDTNGTIVSKGQPLFKVTPDEQFIEEDPAEVRARVESNTEQYLAVVA
ncbi:MAG: HlyD family efflux transporter periplasmic adaptor subunit [Myxococcales bacterium]|nr:MAG: HlyD family efflux transporter periplasmic adaptor subunit [Myxococcales bacterium]